MRSLAPPAIDSRTAADIAAKVEALLGRYTAGAWKPGDTPDPGQALVNIFAHFTGIIIDRLNRTPDKAFIAFLNMIGVSQLPPQPAVAPLTFHIARGATGDARVPAGSRVASTPAQGESDPPVFETTSELFLTGAELVALYVKDPIRDAWGDLSALATAARSATPIPGLTLFTGSQAVERRLWISDPMFTGQGPRDVTIAISAGPSDATFPDLEWGRWDGVSWQTFDKSSFTFRRSNGGLRLTFSNMPPLPVAAAVQANGTPSPFSGAWLGARLPHDLANAAFALPPQQITTIKVNIAAARDQLFPDAVFSGSAAVDASKDFLPFGERPKLGDVFLLASNAAFAPAGPVDSDNQQIITLTISASDLEGGRLPPPDPGAKDGGKVTLVWEYWNGGRWRPLGQSNEGSPSLANPDHTDFGFADSTHALMGMKQAGDAAVTFHRPADWAPSAIAGQLNYWLRVRIAGGDYGRDAYYTKTTVDGKDAYTLVAATWRPPSLRAIALSYKYTSPAVNPQRVLLEGNQVLTDQSATIAAKGAAFALFPPDPDPTPSFYLGFRRPDAATAFANQPVTLYVGIEANNYKPTKRVDLPTAGKPPEVAWEYRSADGWRWLGAQDQTAGFTRDGLVTFMGPADLTPTIAFGQTACWLRARLDSGNYAVLPRVNRILTNTVWAQHTASNANEVVGSGTAEPGLTFYTGMTPVLVGQRVEVRESEPPSASDQMVLKAEEGADCVTIVNDDAGTVSEVWVRWHEVPDFYQSGPGSRHYTLDRLTGAIAFGGGDQGRAPPRGANNIRISYQSGGGSVGNRPAGVITQMKSAIPYVDSAINYEAAAGGADSQSVDEARRRGPAILRHQNRAVAIADYEDLAFMASPAVARAKCIPTRAADTAGHVELIVVPRSDETLPVPSLELLQRVQDFVTSFAAPTVDLVVRGPDWLGVSAHVELAPISFDNAMELRNAVQSRLTAFLNPLTGGVRGEGWEFGRRPHRSDFYAVIEAVEGVDYVRALTVTNLVDAPDSDATLVYAGPIDIVLVAPSRTIP